MQKMSKILIGAVLLQFSLISTAVAIDNTGNFNILNKIPEGKYNTQSQNNYVNSTRGKDLSGFNTYDKVEDETTNLSVIEKIFYQKNNDKKNINNLILKQFGYDTFEKGSFFSSNSQVTKSYKFAIGDKIDVFFWGDSVDLIAITGNEFLKSSNDLVVGKEGNISIPGVGLITAKGKTASVVEQEILGILHSKFNKVNVKVTLADAGNFPVIVTGNVKYKGTVYLNSNANIIDALSLAGGITKTGSLREVVYINGKNKSKLTLDLYDFLINGNLQNISFNEGDILFVKPIGKVIALREGVKNPGIYEFKNNETLMHLVNSAGGLLPSIDSKIINVESFDREVGEKRLKEVPYKNLWYIKPVDGDNISFKNLYDNSENIISVEGNIKHPGTFQYRPGLKLSNIIKNKNELLSQTFGDQAVIERLSGTSKEKTYIPVSLIDLFNGNNDPVLKPQDKIRIYASTTADTIELSGYITNPGLIPCPENLTLKKLLGYVSLGNSSDFQAVSNRNWNNYNEATAKNIVVEVISKHHLIKLQDKTQEDKDQSNSTLNNKSDAKNNFNAINVLNNEKNTQNAEKIEVQQSLSNQDPTSEQVSETKLVYLYDLIVKNDAKYDIPIYPGDKVMFRTLLPNETVESISVLGYVNAPGSFKYKSGMKLKDAIQLAHGLDSKGYLKGIVLLRPSIAEEQKKNIEDSLIKLQEEISLKVNSIQSMNTNATSTDVQNYLSSQKDLLDVVKEKAQKDYGRLIIEIKSNNIDEIDDTNNIELKPGDELYIPYKSNHVVVMGEVLNNSAVIYKPRMTSDYYLKKVGGYTDQAKKNKTYIIKANGSVEKSSKFSKISMEPGDTIVVPKKISIPVNWLEVTKSVAQIAGNILSSMFILTKI